MGKKDINSIFSFFRGKRRKLTPKEQKELTIEKARAISDKMASDKKEIRELFLQKLLENAQEYNKAKEDFCSDNKQKEENKNGDFL